MANKDIRTILAPLTDGYVMLPNSAVGEILTFTSPEPFEHGPPWLLGEVAWHGWQVPVIIYERLLGSNGMTTITAKTRVLIVKTLGESTQVNYIGLVIQGLPRLKKVNASTLVEKQTDDVPDTVFSKVTIDDLHAVIPDLGELTHTVEIAAYES